MRQGDYVMVMSGILHFAGRVACGAGVLLPPTKGRVNLDVNVLGNHLPQFYRPEECTPIVDVDLAAHGLCPECLGFGLTTMDDFATPDDVLSGRHGTVCPDCGGSGRVGVKVTITHSVDGATASVDVDVTEMYAVTCAECRRAYA